MPKGRPTTMQDKVACIQRIVKNPTYDQDSAMVKRLELVLHKLSASDLANLELIMNIKIQQATNEGFESGMNELDPQ